MNHRTALKTLQQLILISSFKKMATVKKTFYSLKGIIVALSLFAITVVPASAYYSLGQPAGFVNDYAGVLSAEQKNILESRLVSFEKETSNEIAIAIIDSLKEDTIENFAVELFQEWGIGKKSNDNGVLILVAVSDRQMRIEVGYGLEGALTDSQAYWIIENKMKPAFRNNDFYLGLSDASDAIISATKGEYIPSASEKKDISWDGIEFFIFLGFIIFQALMAAIASSKSWWLGGVVGAIIGIIVWFFAGWIIGLILVIILTPLGLLFDFLASNSYQKAKSKGHNPWWYGGFGGGSGGIGGGFGGFGGGGSGGGGSSDGW